MKKLFFLPVVSFLCVILTTIVQPQVKTNIAIIAFEARGGLSASEAAILADRLRSGLVQTNAFIVLDRGKMDEILKEVGFQQTGCTTSECAVEVGKILNVQQIVSGAVGKFGQVYTIDIVLIDVATSQILQTFTQNYKGELEGLLDFMTPVANQLASYAKPKGAKSFSLKIDSTPGEGNVFFNNTLVGTTPYVQVVEEAAKLTLVVKKEGYKEWTREITMVRDIKLNANLELLSKPKPEVALKHPAKKNRKWYYIGGAIAVGGAAVILLSGGGKTKPDLPGIENIPWPPNN